VTEFLREWILGMTVMALICSVCLTLTPQCRVKSVLKMACALVMAIALLSPIAKLDMDGYARSLAQYRETLIAAESAGSDSADRLIRTVIENECAAYISDKGAELGLGAVPAQVQAKWGDAFWYPYEVWLGTERSEKLMICIEGELGIPRERMHWTDEINKAE